MQLESWYEETWSFSVGSDSDGAFNPAIGGIFVSTVVNTYQWTVTDWATVDYFATLPMNDGPLPLNLGQWSGPDIIQRPQPCEPEILSAGNKKFGRNSTVNNVIGPPFAHSTFGPPDSRTNLALSC